MSQKHLQIYTSECFFELKDKVTLPTKIDQTYKLDKRRNHRDFKALHQKDNPLIRPQQIYTSGVQLIILFETQWVYR